MTDDARRVRLTYAPFPQRIPAVVTVIQRPSNAARGPSTLAPALAGLDAAERALVEQAAAFAAPLYEGKRLGTGEPALDHAYGLAGNLAQLRIDAATRAAVLLYAVSEYLPEAAERLTDRFEPAVAALVSGVAKLNSLRVITRGLASAEEKGRASQAEILRKMLLAMVEDIRVVLIRLASRTQTLRFLAKAPDESVRVVARETLDVYAPLANRLGVWQLKWELEDLSFRFLEPELYKRIAKQLDERRAERESFIAEAIAALATAVRAAGIAAEISGRPKHIYSIYTKMRQKGLEFSELYDVRGVRVLVAAEKDCYAVLGIVHDLWQAIPEEFDDYISRPKSNNYRSLHTAVAGPDGRALEVQIRTHEMHRHAELGVAAHWRYKEGKRGPAEAVDDRIAWLRQVLAWRDEVVDSAEWVEPSKRAARDDTVYVLTPQGRVIDLARGATPIDFAYALHTDLGHRCRGAKVDGAMVPLDTKLANGQRVEIIAAKVGGPSRDWLNPQLGYIASSRAEQGPAMVQQRGARANRRRRPDDGRARARARGRYGRQARGARDAVRLRQDRGVLRRGRPRGDRPASDPGRGPGGSAGAGAAGRGDRHEEEQGGRRGDRDPDRRRRPADDAAGALLQAGAAGRDRRVRDAWARHLGASPRLPQPRAAARPAARARDRDRLGRARRGGVPRRHRGAGPRPPGAAARRLRGALAGADQRHRGEHPEPPARRDDVLHRRGGGSRSPASSPRAGRRDSRRVRRCAPVAPADGNRAQAARRTRGPRPDRAAPGAARAAPLVGSNRAARHHLLRHAGFPAGARGRGAAGAAERRALDSDAQDGRRGGRRAARARRARMAACRGRDRPRRARCDAVSEALRPQARAGPARTGLHDRVRPGRTDALVRRRHRGRARDRPGRDPRGQPHRGDLRGRDRAEDRRRAAAVRARARDRARRTVAARSCEQGGARVRAGTRRGSPAAEGPRGRPRAGAVGQRGPEANRPGVRCANAGERGGHARREGSGIPASVPGRAASAAVLPRPRGDGGREGGDRAARRGTALARRRARARAGLGCVRDRDSGAARARVPGRRGPGRIPRPLHPPAPRPRRGRARSGSVAAVHGVAARTRRSVRPRRSRGVAAPADRRRRSAGGPAGTPRTFCRSARIRRFRARKARPAIAQGRQAGAGGSARRAASGADRREEAALRGGVPRVAVSAQTRGALRRGARGLAGHPRCAERRCGRRAVARGGGGKGADRPARGGPDPGLGSRGCPGRTRALQARVAGVRRGETVLALGGRGEDVRVGGSRP